MFGEVGAVADREDQWVAGAQVSVDDDAVVDREARFARQRVFGHRANAEHQPFDRLANAVDLQTRQLIAVDLEPIDTHAEPQPRAGRRVVGLHMRGQLRRHRSRQQPRHALEHLDLDAEATRSRRDLQPDEAATEYRQTLHHRQMAAQRVGVFGTAQHHDVRQPGGQVSQPPCPRAGGEHELAVAEFDARMQPHALRGAVDRNRRVGAVQRDACLGVPGLGTVCLQRFVGLLQEGLRQRRALVRQHRFFAHQMHTAALPRFNQRGAKLRTGMATADDDDRFAAAVHALPCSASGNRFAQGCTVSVSGGPAGAGPLPRRLPAPSGGRSAATWGRLPQTEMPTCSVAVVPSTPLPPIVASCVVTPSLNTMSVAKLTRDRLVTLAS